LEADVLGGYRTYRPCLDHLALSLHRKERIAPSGVAMKTCPRCGGAKKDGVFCAPCAQYFWCVKHSHYPYAHVARPRVRKGANHGRRTVVTLPPVSGEQEGVL
jgi:hypothetical protein